MGSEHYCLRWNNHQSNLLGVFSQLLQDESLVDVTLSCSEGAPIRAHKVVLSACSSYFQSLFLDHPERHPIVILKDVRFAELQTLVEFMYKGEVNVQYCQLSALLKTAESLKVKGLAEMTNQNTTLREPEREPDRLRTQTSKASCESPVDAALAGPSSTTTSLATTPSSLCSTGTTIAHITGDSSTTANITASHSSKNAPPPTSLTSSTSGAGHKREANERCSSTPPKRLSTSTAKIHERIDSPLPLDLYQRRSDVEEISTRSIEASGGHGGSEGTSNSNINQPNRSSPTHGGSCSTIGGISGTSNSCKTQHDDGDEFESLGNSPKRTSTTTTTTTGDVEMRIEKIEAETEDYEEEMDLEDEDAEADDNSSSNEIGLNMKIGIMGHASLTTVVSLPLDTGGGSSAVAGGGGGIVDIESARSTPAISSNMPSDLTQRPASRSSRDGGASSAARTPTERPSSSGLCGSLAAASSGMSPSSSGLATAGNLESESLASTSGLGPVQSVPLSLKKEIECSEDDNSNSRHIQPRSASAGGGLGSEHDYRASHESLLRNFGLGGNSSTSPFSARCPTPFPFPFSPLGLSLFDIDPSRILSMLHHQTWLAEETLRNRGLLSSPKELSHRFTPLELFSKDYHANNFHGATADILGGITSAQGNATATATSTAASSTSKSSYAAQLSPHSQQQYKQQPFGGLRYPSPAAFFHHHHQPQQQQQQQQHHQSPSQRLKHTRSNTPLQNQTASSTQAAAASAVAATTTSSRNESILEELRRKSEASNQREDDDAIIELSSNDETPLLTTSRAPSTLSANILYKESLEQLLQQRRHSGDNLRSYTQLLLSNTPSCVTDTSSCKEKSSSSSTSSTPPPTSALLAQHQHLSQMLKSPSETSSLFSEPIEEETRCVVCNAHFPNVWLLEQHAALQHPHIGPGEEKPFICEQCGQSYRYRSAYAKHKEQNHRARLPADKLFTCDVCGMQFRYLKSFKKHRLNHALERLHGKKSGGGKYNTLPTAHLEQDIVTSSQEALLAAEENGEDLRINVKRERIDDEERERARSREGDQDSTIDSAGIALLYNDNNSTASASTSSAAAEPNITSSDVIHSTNQRPRLLNTTHMETDPSFQHQHPAHHHHHHHHLQQPQTLTTHLQAVAAAAAAVSPPGVPSLHAAAHPATAMNSLSSLNSITSLINAERIPSEQFLGLNPQEASILNFLRVDAAERQRDKRPPTSRFACPFCGKCVRSKENLKLHVRKHTGERPFVCLFCGRAFGGKSDLTRHLRIHTGERPYHCESCGKCFARADYLSKHLTTHIHNAPR